MSALPDVPQLPAAPASRRVSRERFVLLGRGTIALVLGLAITFSPEHSAVFGRVVFGGFALLTAAVLLSRLVDDLTAKRSIVTPGLLLVLSVVAGVLVLLLPPTAFVSIVSGWALLSGTVELVDGVRERHAGRPSLNAIILGSLSVILAVVLLVVPPDYSEPWQVLGQQGGLEAAGAVTADIMTVGILGAWAVVHGVLLVIAALSPIPAEQSA